MVLVLDLLYLETDSLDFVCAGVGLSLEVGVRTEQLLDKEVGALELHAELVDVGSEVKNILLVEVGFKSN